MSFISLNPKKMKILAKPSPRTLIYNCGIILDKMSPRLHPQTSIGIEIPTT
jgi:hypothetical protein